MKKLVALLALLVSALCILPNGSAMASAENAGFVFCETFDDKYTPVNPGDTFASGTVSWVTHSDKPFGVLALSLSIYKVEGQEEKLVKRQQVDINPDWDTIGIRYIPVEEGNLKFALTTLDGKTVCAGMVNISKPEKAEEPKKQETLGGRLEALFNHYKPKQ